MSYCMLLVTARYGDGILKLDTKDYWRFEEHQDLDSCEKEGRIKFKEDPCIKTNVVGFVIYDGSTESPDQKFFPNIKYSYVKEDYRSSWNKILHAYNMTKEKHESLIQDIDELLTLLFP